MFLDNQFVEDQYSQSPVEILPSSNNLPVFSCEGGHGHRLVHEARVGEIAQGGQGRASVIQVLEEAALLFSLGRVFFLFLSFSRWCVFFVVASGLVEGGAAKTRKTACCEHGLLLGIDVCGVLWCATHIPSVFLPGAILGNSLETFKGEAAKGPSGAFETPKAKGCGAGSKASKGVAPFGFDSKLPFANPEIP